MNRFKRNKYENAYLNIYIYQTPSVNVGCETWSISSGIQKM